MKTITRTITTYAYAISHRVVNEEDGKVDYYPCGEIVCDSKKSITAIAKLANEKYGDGEAWIIDPVPTVRKGTFSMNLGTFITYAEEVS